MDKLSIDSAKVLTTAEQVQVKEYLRGKAHIEAIPAKNDYEDEKHRGTLHFNTEKGNPFNPEALKMRNYSYHKILIPDGTTVKGCNFTQVEPHTVAISGQNLTFVECNLKNVEIDNSWTLQGCLAIHAREVIDGIDKVYEVEKDGKFVEVSREIIEAEVK